ncbi:14958_t:CDS:1, partial [Gigaspora margarita]
IQAKIRQYKPCPSPEKKVTRLHKRTAELQEEVIRYPEREELKIVIEQLQGDLQEELTSLAERWQIQSNTRWIEEEERSTKYFFARYRSHHAISLISKVKIPNKVVDETPVNILQYAKETYEKLYKLDRVNLDAITEFSVIDQIVSKEHNYELVKEITAKEIEETIGSLAYNKAPGVDGLSYEFYKGMKVEITSVLKTLFNE